MYAVWYGNKEIEELITEKQQEKIQKPKEEAQKLQEKAKIATVKPYRSTPTQRLLCLRKLHGCR